MKNDANNLKLCESYYAEGGEHLLYRVYYDRKQEIYILYDCSSGEERKLRTGKNPLKFSETHSII